MLTPIKAAHAARADTRAPRYGMTMNLVNRMNKTATLLGMTLALAGLISVPAHSYAASGDVEAGREIARANCARCHGIGRTDDSPLEQAPPFRRLHERYPIDQLAEAFAEGIVVGHMEMPPFEFQSAQIQALLAYFKSLETTPRR